MAASTDGAKKPMSERERTRKQVRALRKKRNESGIAMFKKLGLKAGTGKVNGS